MHCLKSLLGIHEKPEDDLENVEGLCVEDSCGWLLEKTSFQQWRDEGRGRIFWITAKPATGKSYVWLMGFEYVLN